MLDVRQLSRDQERLKSALQRRNFSLDTEQLNLLISERARLQQQTETLQRQRNVASKEIGKMSARGEDVVSLKASIAEIGEQLSVLKKQLKEAQDSFHAFMLSIPNLPDDSVPPGDSDAHNVQLHSFGTPRVFDFPAKDHVDLGEQLGLLDFAAAARIAGSRFSVLKGPLARLHSALAQFMLKVHTQTHGYEEVYVPFIARADALVGTGQLPKFAEDQFQIQDNQHDLYLIATGEISATNLVRETIIDAEQLPLKFVTHTPCFRKEAGNYGKDTRGMIRQHQFEKVELVQIVKPEDSWQTLETLTGHASRVLELLGLPYRIMVLCGGDLGFAAAKTYDLEVWLPGQQCYREISSCSNYLDFQARRMQARWRNPETGKPELVHTLNGSGLAVGRTLVAILENYQDAKGRIHVPEVLLPWMGDLQVIG